MYVCGIVGLMSVGGMIATLIGATTPLQFADGTVVIQDILDSMMPQMISLGLTGLMYWLIKKNVNTGWLLVIAIVGGIALIIVLFIVVKMIFAMLAQVVPPERLNPEAFASQSQSQSQEQPAGDGQADQGPAFCPFCGEEMTDSFQWGQFCPFCGEKVER